MRITLNDTFLQIMLTNGYAGNYGSPFFFSWSDVFQQKMHLRTIQKSKMIIKFWIFKSNVKLLVQCIHLNIFMFGAKKYTVACLKNKYIL